MAVSLTARDTPGRGCTCCPVYPHRRKDRMRRHVRRVAKQALRSRAV